MLDILHYQHELLERVFIAVVWIKFTHQAVDLRLLPTIVLADHVKITGCDFFILPQVHGCKYLSVQLLGLDWLDKFGDLRVNLLVKFDLEVVFECIGSEFKDARVFEEFVVVADGLHCGLELMVGLFFLLGSEWH